VVDELIFGAGNEAVNETGGELFFVDTHLTHSPLDGGLGVGGVEDQKVTGEANFGGFTAQQAQADGVEGTDEREVATVTRVEPQQFEHPAAHFSGGFVSEGDGQDINRPHVLLGHQVGDAVREGLGFARAGAGQD